MAAGKSGQVASGGPEAFIEATERGLERPMIGGVINGLSHFIVAGKKFKSYEDLRGATFGAPAKYIDQSFINEAIKDLKRK